MGFSKSILYISSEKMRCHVGGRHLPSVSYGQSHIQTPVLTELTVFANLDRLVSLHIQSGRLCSNSCSAALICAFCATRRIRFFVSDLSRNDPPGQAPPSRGR